MKLVETSIQTWLEGLDASTMKLGLARMERLLNALGNPEQGLPVVHIAGTNGKGSVVAMLGGVLRAAGYKTGAYTSPHLLHVRERISVEGSPILPDDFEAGLDEIRKAVDRLDWDANDRPTYFEVLNALAFLHFKRLYTQGNLDLVLLEVGLGGRLDSTNVVKQPNVCVITGIAYDHTEHLGHTLAEIAGEKAGIIKRGVPVIVGPNVPEEAQSVITGIAYKTDAPCTVASAETLTVLPRSHPADGLLITASDKPDHPYRLSLTAPYQRGNLATVLAVIAQLRQQGYNVSESAIADGLSQTRWPARFQYFSKQRIVLDASHNAQGLDSLADAVAFYFPGRPLYWLTSLRKNRDAQLLLSLLSRFGKQTQGVTFTCTEPAGIYHAPDTLADAARAQEGALRLVSAIADPLQAFAQLQQQLKANPEAVGIVTGSLYTAGRLLQKLS